MHVKCKALEDLTEYLAPITTPEAERIVELATVIWSSSTAVEVLGFAAEVLPAREFAELGLLVRAHYPLIFVAYQSNFDDSDQHTQQCIR